jgi:hypothetical protein
MPPKKPNPKQLNQIDSLLTPPKPRQLEPETDVKESAPVGDRMPDEEERPSVAAEEKPPKPGFKKPFLAQQPSVQEASNADGQVFNLGEQIRVRAPWGGIATAEITAFYKDGDGNIWAQHKPVDSQENWSWEGGCILAALLTKFEIPDETPTPES